MIKKTILPILISVLGISQELHAQQYRPEAPIVKESLLFEEKEGILAVEAEHFFQQSLTDIRKWYIYSQEQQPKLEPDIDGFHGNQASRNGYIELLPDSRENHDDKLVQEENFTNSPGAMAVLHYKVKINTPGRYYVWVRAFSTGTEDNGLHVGFDNTWPEHGQRMQWCEGKNNWTWGSRQRTKEEHCGIAKEIYLDIDEAGVHDIQFSMREDGFEFDKFILTQDIDYIPHGVGPETQVAAGTLPVVGPQIAAPAGRIAVVADGNSPDPDDLGGTAVSIALLRAAGLEDRLVHYSHSCDLERGDRISARAEKERHTLMQVACDITARRWGGFDALTFFDALWQEEETISDLAEAINQSSAEDPLWIIEAGEPDIIGKALEASQPDKHPYVRVITHHPANDDAGDFYSWQQILDFGVSEIRIPDQNTLLKVDLPLWDWARDHPDPRIQWVWLMGKAAEIDDVVKFQKGKWDCSDAGMILYWITGATDGGLSMGSVEDVKYLLTQYVQAHPEGEK